MPDGLGDGVSIDGMQQFAAAVREPAYTASACWLRATNDRMLWQFQQHAKSSYSGMRRYGSGNVTFPRKAGTRSRGFSTASTLTATVRQLCCSAPRSTVMSDCVAGAAVSGLKGVQGAEPDPVSLQGI